MQGQQETLPFSSSRRKALFSAEKEINKQFAYELQLSAGQLEQSARTRLLQLRQDAEDKVHAKLEQSNHDFLLILLKQRNEKIAKELPTLQEKLQSKQNGIINQLKQQSISIERTKKSLRAIRKELQDSLHIMRTNNPERQTSEAQLKEQQRREEIKYQNYLEFRKQNYWKQPNQKSKSALQFLQNINNSQKRVRAKYDSIQRESQKKQAESFSQVKREKEEAHKRARQQVHERYQLYRQQRQNELQEQAKKQREAEQFLAKYKEKVPAHIAFCEKEKQQSFLQEKRLQHVLKEYKAKRRGYSINQITQSLREYEEYKEMRAQQLEQRRVMEVNQEQRIKSQLNCLYKSRLRAYCAEKEQPSKKETSQQKLMKMMVYSSKVKESFKPQIDNYKREQLLQEIADARKKEHKIIKVRDGQVIFLDKDELRPREIGLQYLEEVKQMTSQIERKAPVLSTPEGTKIKDKSLQSKKIDKKQFTITNWREILESERMSASEKEEKLQCYFQLVEQQQLRSQSGRRITGLSHSIELQNKFDHYQLEKAAAKLALLKSLM